MKTRKHAELIKAWADGAEIQLRGQWGWCDTEPPRWDENTEYRIKPKKTRIYVLGPHDEYKMLVNLAPVDYEYILLTNRDQLQGVENPQIIWCDDWWKYVECPVEMLGLIMIRTR